MLSRIIQRFFGRRSLTVGAPQFIAGLPPEVLESRRLFDGATFASGVLTVTGDSLQDTIIIYRNTSDQKVRVQIDGVQYGSGWDTSGVNAVTRVDVSGLGGDDSITVERNSLHSVGTTGVNIPTHLVGGSGNDAINGGDNNDTVWGDDGTDTLNGFESDDTMYGGTGNDTMDGGTNNDLMYGGYDNDSVVGNSGTDTLWGESGNDEMIGGNDSDTMYGGLGDDTFFAFDGFADYLDGGDGTDTSTNIDTGTPADTFVGMEIYP